MVCFAAPALLPQTCTTLLPSHCEETSVYEQLDAEIVFLLCLVGFKWLRTGLQNRLAIINIG